MDHQSKPLKTLGGKDVSYSGVSIRDLTVTQAAPAELWGSLGTCWVVFPSSLLSGFIISDWVFFQINLLVSVSDLTSL